MAEVVIEAPRPGRRPRYHRGARLSNGLIAKPEQCNLDQTIYPQHILDRLPVGKIRRPLTQLCLRCFRGHPLLTPLGLQPPADAPSGDAAIE